MVSHNIPSTRNEEQKSSPRRRYGVFRRVNDLYDLLILESALIFLYYPSGRPFPTSPPGDSASNMADQGASFHELKSEYVPAFLEVAVEDRPRKELQRLLRILRGKSVMDVQLDDLDLDELAIFGDFMAKLIEDIQEKRDILSNENSNDENACLVDGSSVDSRDHAL